tara:strand:- start:212 stop:655 length:444 start_codon:yes stop_codon:yes gene_type:complete
MGERRRKRKYIDCDGWKEMTYPIEHSGTYGYHKVRENRYENKWSCCYSNDKRSTFCDFDPKGFQLLNKEEKLHALLQSYSLGGVETIGVSVGLEKLLQRNPGEKGGAIYNPNRTNDATRLIGGEELYFKNDESLDVYLDYVGKYNKK